MTSENRPIFQQLHLAKSRPYAMSEYMRRFAWTWMERLVIRHSPQRAWRWRNWWLRRFGATISPRAGFRPDAKITHPWLLRIGDYSMIANGVVIYNLGQVTIGDQTVISQDAYICAGTHDYTQPDLPLLRPPIVIGSGVWICAGAFIGPGVTIGDNSIVGARSVVTRDVPPGMIVAGNPARVIKPRPMPSTPQADIKEA